MPRNKKPGGGNLAMTENRENVAVLETEEPETEAAAQAEPGEGGSPAAFPGNEEHPARKEKIKKEKPVKKEAAPAHFLNIFSLKALKNNAVLVRILAVCTVLGAATALKNGLLLSAAAVVVTIPLYLIMALCSKKLPAYLYFAVATLIAGVLITPVALLANRYFPVVTGSCAYFLPITALNAVLMLDIRIARGERRIIRSLSAGLGDVVGFSVVVVIISAVREIIGSGALYGKIIPDYARFRFDFALLPPGAFLLLGFVLAIVQGVRLHTSSKNDDGEAR